MKTLCKTLPLAALLMACLSAAQDYSQKVSYSTVAVPVRRAVAEIAKATKTPLEASPTVANEVLVISVKDVPLEQLMANMAKAVSGEWNDHDGVRYLTRSNERHHAEYLKELAARRAALKRAVDKLLALLKENPRFDEKTASEMASKIGEGPGMVGILQGGDMAAMAQGARSLFTQGANHPGGRATARLLAMVDLGVLAKLNDEERIVFSTRPNLMQAPLPGGAIQVINQFIQEQNVWADAVNRRKADQSSMIGQAIGMAIGANYSEIKGNPDKALLCVERSAMLDSYDVRLKIFDRQGKLLYQGGQTVLLDSSVLNVMDSMLKVEPTKDAEITLTAESKELIEFYRGMTSVLFGASKVKNLSKALLDKLARPDLYDPLSFIHSEALLALASGRKAHLVANVPDSILRASAFALPGQKLTANGFLKQLTDLSIVDIEEKDGWMLVKPVRPFNERQRRVDRFALAQLISQTARRGYLALDDLAAYALKNPPFTSTEITQAYSMTMLPGGAVTMGAANWNMLRFYGTLSLAQKQALARGARIPFRNLATNQMELVRRMAFRSSLMGGIIIRTPQGPEATPLPGAFVQDYRSEPTELMPGGLPSDGEVTLALRSDWVVRDAGENQPRVQIFSAFGPEELAAFHSLKENPTLGGFVGGLVPDLNVFRMAERVNYTFTFNLTPEASMTQALTDLRYDPAGPVIDVNRLPGEFRKRYDETKAQLKKAGGLGAVLGGLFGQPNPRP